MFGRLNSDLAAERQNYADRQTRMVRADSPKAGSPKADASLISCLASECGIADAESIVLSLTKSEARMLRSLVTGEAVEISDANRWQLMHRLRRKIQEQFNGQE